MENTWHSNTAAAITPINNNYEHGLGNYFYLTNFSGASLNPTSPLMSEGSQYTIDCWFVTNGGRTINNPGFGIYNYLGTRVVFGFESYSNTVRFYSELNSFTHPSWTYGVPRVLGFELDGESVRVYSDGTYIDTLLIKPAYGSLTPYLIGHAGQPAGFDEFRITTGFRYKNNQTRPLLPFAL